MTECLSAQRNRTKRWKKCNAQPRNSAHECAHESTLFPSLFVFLSPSLSSCSSFPPLSLSFSLCPPSPPLPSLSPFFSPPLPLYLPLLLPSLPLLPSLSTYIVLKYTNISLCPSLSPGWRGKPSPRRGYSSRTCSGRTGGTARRAQELCGRRTLGL